MTRLGAAQWLTVAAALALGACGKSPCADCPSSGETAAVAPQDASKVEVAAPPDAPPADSEPPDSQPADSAPAPDLGPDYLYAGPPNPTAGEPGIYVKQPTVPLAPPQPKHAIPANTPPGPWQDPKTGETVYVLPNGRTLTPAGQQLFLGAYPLGVLWHPNGKIVYVANEGKAKAVQVVDVAAGKIVQTVPEPYIYRWLAMAKDQQHLFASGGPQSPSFRFQVAADGTLTKDKTYSEKYGCYGIAPSPDGQSVYCAVGYGSLTAGGKTKPQLWKIGAEDAKPVAAADLLNVPYDLAVSPDGKTAYVVSWLQGIVQRVDTATLATPDKADALYLGANGQGLALAPDGKRLYASSVEGDFIAVIDAVGWGVTAKISLNLGNVVGMAPQGRDPGLLALSPDGQRLYAVCAMSNEVAVIDTGLSKLVGAVPVGWYPSGVSVNPQSGQLAVVNAKGTGFPKGWVDASAEDGYLGTLSLVATPTDAQAKLGAETVLDNLYGISGVGRIPGTAEQKSVLPDHAPSPQIQHVIYIMRENKTFDVELGDLAGQITGVVAEPSLALFGEEYTPNLHKLAKEFCLLDNFYTDGDYSATGHSYSTATKASDYIEKHYRMLDKGVEFSFGVGQSSRPAHGFLFQNVLAHGHTVQSFGEIVGMVDAFSMTTILHPDYPGFVFNMNVADIDKASWFAEYIKGKDLPQFALISVPVNHTCCGGDPDHPSPKSMVADNDEATGLLVEAISLHKDWTSTVIFIFEDDPQDGGDSVEYHRSPLLVVSPWVQRGKVNHDHHAMGGMHATMERALDVTPLTELDGLSAPIYGCFAASKDTKPYQHIARIYPPTLNKEEKKKKWTKAIKAQWQRIGASKYDEAEGLGRLLWEMYQGQPAPWPRARYTPFGDDGDDD